LYFFGSGTTEPAISREIMENDLMETFHWLPQDIAKIPYKKLQKIMLIRKHRMSQYMLRLRWKRLRKNSITLWAIKGLKVDLRDL